MTFAAGVAIQLSFMRAPNQVTVLNGKKVGKRAVASVQSSIQYITDNVKPVDFRNLILGSHANDASLRMKMFNSQGDEKTSFETLQKTQTEPGKSIVIPTTLTGPPQNPPAHAVRIIGCNLGKATVFVQELKKALGNNVRVVAPKHFDGVSWGKGYGLWEFLCYEFSVYLPKLPKTKKPRELPEIMAEFQRVVAASPPGGPAPAPFQFIDGSRVPDAYWKDENWYKPDPVGDVTMDLAAPIKLAAPLGPVTTVGVRRGLDLEFPKISWPVPIPDPTKFPKLDDKAKCLELLRADMILDKKYAPKSRFVGGTGGHPYPMFTRFNYADLDKMLAGLGWTFSREEPHDGLPLALRCLGEQAAYTLILPITDPAPTPDPKVGKVLTNFHPDPKRFAGVPDSKLPPPALSLDDPALYLTV
jgi:hypothetical protein